MRGFAKKILPALQELQREMPPHGGKTRLGNDLRKLVNLAVMYANGVPARGDPVQDVEFRYSVDSCRIESPMEEAK